MACRHVPRFCVSIGFSIWGQLLTHLVGWKATAKGLALNVSGSAISLIEGYRFGMYCDRTSWASVETAVCLSEIVIPPEGSVISALVSMAELLIRLPARACLLLEYMKDLVSSDFN